MNEHCCILVETSRKHVERPFSNDQAFVQIMAWRRKGDNPLTEPLVVLFTDAYAPFGLDDLIIYSGGEHFSFKNKTLIR